jgi:quercetin dioxygenase-like cupin family protein
MDSWDVANLEFEPHQPQVLRSDDDTRVIAIQLPAGEELGEHQVHERAYLVVAAGEVEVDGGGEQARGGAGFVAHFDPRERHTVRALSDARLVLLLAPWPGEGHPSTRPAAA